jgi:hypothetical protein
MSFLYPAFLIGAAAAVVPLLLHLLKRETAPPVRFSAVRLLLRAPVERTRRQRLRELLLLALRVSALVLLAAAFARPYLAGSAAGADRVTIVALDTSFSMGSPGRFETARQLAREAIEAVPAGELVGVVGFDDRAIVVADPSRDRSAALTALASLEPGSGATRYRTALERAAAAIGGREGQLVLVTDLQRSGWRAQAEGALPARIPVHVRDVGGVPSNLAVVAVITEDDHLKASLRNGGAGSRRGVARLYVDDREFATVPFALEPGATVDATFDRAVPKAGVARVEFDDTTGYPADDRRYLVLDPPAPPAVLLVAGQLETTSAGAYVQRALEVPDGQGAFDLERVRGSELAAALQKRIPAVIVLLSTRGVDPAAESLVERHLRHGGGLLVAAGEEVGGDELRAVLGDRTAAALEIRRPSEALALSPTDMRHPILRLLEPMAGDLGRVRFTEVAAIDEEGWSPIARFDDGTAAIVERRLEKGRLIFVASDLDRVWNDFPLHPTFAPFLHEAVRYLAGDWEWPRAYLVADAPAGATAVPGVSFIGVPPRPIVVNVDPRESDPARLTPDEFEADIRRSSGGATAHAEATLDRQAESAQGYWRYGLMLVLITLAAEGLVGRGE